MPEKVTNSDSQELLPVSCWVPSTQGAVVAKRLMELKPGEKLDVTIKHGGASDLLRVLELDPNEYPVVDKLGGGRSYYLLNPITGRMGPETGIAVTFQRRPR